MNVPVPVSFEYTCEDNVLAAVASYFGKPYEPCYLYTWDFRYDQSLESLTDKIIGIDSKKLKIMKEVLGISFSLLDSRSELKYKKMQEAMNNNECIIVTVNCINAEWMEDKFGVVDLLHFMLVKNISDDSIEICDGEDANEGVVVAHSALDRALVKSIILLRNDGDCELGNIEKYIYEEASIRQQIFDYYRLFLGDFTENNLNKWLLSISSGIGYDKLIYKISNISKERYQYSKFLKYVGSEININYVEYGERLWESGNIWSSIMGMLVKLSFTKNIITLSQRIRNKIEKNITIEEELNKDILFGKNKNREAVGCHSSNSIIKKKLDISKYFNNKAFAVNLSNQNNAEFSNGGRFFIYNNEDVKQNQDNIYFLLNVFDSVNTIKCDNIALQDQEIDVQANIVGVELVGASEYGNHSDFIDVYSKDNLKKTLKINLTNWSSQAPFFNDNIVWTGVGAEKTDNFSMKLGVKVHLFSQMLYFPSPLDVDFIKMPYCTNMHIFSMSLLLEN